MKLLFLFSLILLSISCVDQSKFKIVDATDLSTFQNTSQNNSVEKVPDEWTDFDFQNFKYPNDWNKNEIQMADGKYNFTDHRGFINFEQVYFADVTKDDSEEAIVKLNEFLCETGCDGGSINFYIFQLSEGKPKLIWKFSGGSKAHDGGLKSFAIKDKVINTEKFIKCVASKKENFPNCSSNYQAKIFYRQTFVFDGKKIVEKSKLEIETDLINVSDYLSEISIYE